MTTVQEKLLEQVKNINEVVCDTEVTNDFKTLALRIMKDKLNELVDELITSLKV